VCQQRRCYRDGFRLVKLPVARALRAPFKHEFIRETVGTVLGISDSVRLLARPLKTPAASLPRLAVSDLRFISTGSLG